MSSRPAWSCCANLRNVRENWRNYVGTLESAWIRLTEEKEFE
jgi:hypothetical protein